MQVCAKIHRFTVPGGAIYFMQREKGIPTTDSPPGIVSIWQIETTAQ